MKYTAILKKPYTTKELNEFLEKYGKQYIIEQTDEGFEAWSYTKQERADFEAKRVYNLSMTKSDFFDGTIKAFGLGKDELKIVIEQTMAMMRMSEIEQKIALNNYDNAKDFYRKHPLFDMLSKIPLILGDVRLVITAKQWDEFFIRTDVKDPDAYKALLPGM